MPNNNIEKLVDIMKNGRNRNLMMGHIMGSDIRYFASELVKNDVVPVIRCKDCEFATEFDKHCEYNQTTYRHCNLWRGDETRNVWHKYKKYYKDYSIVDIDGFCSEGKRKEAKNA